MMRANGFTLIELLVAMTAGALLLSGMSWIVMQLGKQSQRARSVQDAIQLAAALDRVRSLVEGARAGPSDEVALSEHHLSFITNPPMTLGPVGLVRAELDVSRAPGAETLEVSLHDAEGRNMLAGKSTRLLAGQKSIRFSWADQPSSDRKRGSLVKVDIVDQKGRKVDLIVPLRVTGDPGCTFDPISLACR